MQTQNDPLEERAVETEALVVKPAKACVMLDCGHTRFYELIASGELESYLDGSSRKVTIASIRGYIARRLAANSTTQGDTQGVDGPRCRRQVRIR
jgi:hypothetical protein